MNIKTVQGNDVKIGDMIIIMGRTLRITSFRPYNNDFADRIWPEETVRIANLDNGNGITIEPSARYEIVEATK